MWISIEKTFNQKIPECVKEILNANGFTTELSLLSINAETLQNIEKFTNEYLEDTIIKLICCYSNIYKAQVIEKKFCFMPGHKALLLQLHKHLEENKQKRQKVLGETSHIEAMAQSMKSMPDLSNILKEIVLNAMDNFGKIPTQNRYTDIIKYFSIYIYMVCGRKSYEVLQSNLSLPAVSTISEYD